MEEAGFQEPSSQLLCCCFLFCFFQKTPCSPERSPRNERGPRNERKMVSLPAFVAKSEKKKKQLKIKISQSFCLGFLFLLPNLRGGLLLGSPDDAPIERIDPDGISEPRIINQNPGDRAQDPIPAGSQLVPLGDSLRLGSCRLVRGLGQRPVNLV